MDWKAFAKKYGIYIAGGAVLLYFLLRNRSSAASGALGAGDPELARQELAARTALAQGKAGADLELARIQAQLEAQRIKAANDQAARDAALLAQQRALEAQARARQAAGSQSQLQSILNAVASALSKLGGQKGASTSTSGGAGIPRTPPINPNPTASRGGTLAQAAAIVLGGALSRPVDTITAEQAGISNVGISEPNYQSFEAPNFDLPGITFDSGETFYNQFEYPSYTDYYGQSESDFPTLTDPGGYNPGQDDIPTYTPDDFGGLDLPSYGGSGDPLMFENYNDFFTGD